VLSCIGSVVHSLRPERPTSVRSCDVVPVHNRLAFDFPPSVPPLDVRPSWDVLSGGSVSETMKKARPREWLLSGRMTVTGLMEVVRCP
jgi:hypothetical protein